MNFFLMRIEGGHTTSEVTFHLPTYLLHGAHYCASAPDCSIHFETIISGTRVTGFIQVAHLSLDLYLGLISK